MKLHQRPKHTNPETLGLGRPVSSDWLAVIDGFCLFALLWRLGWTFILKGQRSARVSRAMTEMSFNISTPPKKSSDT